MSNHPRPVLLGYIRADRLSNGTGIQRAEAELATFAHREQFSLGTVYVEQGSPAGVFHALMDELARDEAAWGLVVPDLRHLTVVEHLVLRRNDDGRTPVVVASHLAAAGHGSHPVPDHGLQTNRGSSS
ncbi:hypothetical protein [Nocardioides bizhenqiangii]|uniref:Resolvase/invertase-type recombinase catalytic domain-containing protein n=1 Tax=Nocardioides bizhenqiangii TaxID=3095076 RepID=A0ABZ0ZPJ5_9ACTN|nr:MULTISPECIES: hypothetical protein [unclassified Nocardioides]MDZ5619748.1 hypothetical protein [Nocardioides sp. HM23]WQQ26245.1 hypothetical protein SHK19_20065 [Nocardioides sp. HM61]